MRKQIIEQLTCKNVIKIMNSLGNKAPIADIDDDTESIRFTTVCHGGKSEKLYFYKESKYFQCYTNCGSLSIFDIVMKVRNCGIHNATNYICQVLGIQDRKHQFGFQVDESKYLIDDWEFINKYNRPNTVDIKQLPEYDSRVMDLFSKEYHTSWLEDNICIKAMQKFNICYYLPQNAIVIPHYDIDGRLVGIRRRTLNSEEAERSKYMPIYIQNKGYTHPLQFNLYGLHKNKDTIKKLKKVMIVESEKGVLQCETFYPNQNFALALSSSNVSNAQRDMILSLGVEEVIFALDRQYEQIGSEEFKTYQEKMLRLMSKFTPYVNVYILWDLEDLLDYKDSPTDKGKEVLEQLMKKKIFVTTKE